MISNHAQITVLHAKFASYLGWSQPFIHDLVTGVGQHVRSVVLCNRTENLDRFPIHDVVRCRTRDLVVPALAAFVAANVRRRWRPGVIHAHFGWSGVRVLLLSEFLRVPLVTTFGGRDAGTQMFMPHFDRLYRYLLDVSDALICVSEDLKCKLVAHGISPDRIEVIRRGTDLERFPFVDRAERPTRPVQILMVGRLVEKKGHEYAFEALHALLQEGLDIRLTVVGEGDSLDRLHGLRKRLGLQDHVWFAGITDQAGVRRHMTDADLFLHCSVTPESGDCEGIPNVVVEAAATGLPVIGTRHGGIVEPVRHEESGLLVEERDVNGLTDALRRLVQRRDERLALGRQASRLMRREFDRRISVRRHVAIYERLASERAPDKRHLRRPIPDDYGVLIDKACSSNVLEFTLAELLDQLIHTTRISRRIKHHDPTLVERAYELKRFIPPRIKHPAKVAIRRALIWLAERRNTSLGYERLKQLDRLVHKYFQNGGRIDDIDPEWNPDDLFAHLLEASPRGSALSG